MENRGNILCRREKEEEEEEPTWIIRGIIVSLVGFTVEGIKPTCFALTLRIERLRVAL